MIDRLVALWSPEWDYEVFSFAIGVVVSIPIYIGIMVAWCLVKSKQSRKHEQL